MCRERTAHKRDVAAGGADLHRKTGRVSLNGVNLNLYAAGAHCIEAPVSTAACCVLLQVRAADLPVSGWFDQLIDPPPGLPLVTLVNTLPLAGR